MVLFWCVALPGRAVRCRIDARRQMLATGYSSNPFWGAGAAVFLSSTGRAASSKRREFAWEAAQSRRLGCPIRRFEAGRSPIPWSRCCHDARTAARRRRTRQAGAAARRPPRRASQDVRGARAAPRAAFTEHAGPREARLRGAGPFGSLLSPDDEPQRSGAHRLPNNCAPLRPRAVKWSPLRPRRRGPENHKTVPVIVGGFR
mmetsp:Transcript_2518/g.5954  ORF Transcript_2518/g.5954 Transcript_2518/m.5954 type:complete len:202 (-) Transcript_2518:1136-1741(-)